LFLSIRIGKKRASSHDVFSFPTPEVGFIDCYEDADAPLRRVQRKHLRPRLVERAVNNLRSPAATIAKKLEGKSVGARIEASEKPSRHLLVVRWRGAAGRSVGRRKLRRLYDPHRFTGVGFHDVLVTSVGILVLGEPPLLGFFLLRPDVFDAKVVGVGLRLTTGFLDCEICL
jgi:hypothetical protein